MPLPGSNSVESNSSPQPVLQIFLNKLIVWLDKVGICFANAINLFALPRRKVFIRIEAPASFEQTLATEHFVDPWDASLKSVTRVNNSRVHVSYSLRIR